MKSRNHDEPTFSFAEESHIVWRKIVRGRACFRLKRSLGVDPIHTLPNPSPSHFRPGYLRSQALLERCAGCAISWVWRLCQRRQSTLVYLEWRLC